MRLFVVSRHAESTLNHERRVNGDPSRPVGLTERGREEARELGVQLANLAVDACVVTRFPRTRETAEIALAGRDVPIVVEELLDDIDVGDLDGSPVEEYRAWKRAHARSDPFPGGESLDDAAARYAAAWRRLLTLPHDRVAVVCHEIPLRYALNGAGGSGELDAPVHELRNATPYLFTDDSLAEAATGIERILGVPPPG
ncbi:MAG: histidine phosphatase family protein [Thermoleophilia bacterium]|nr:histidine phosphatase family protein [Thermoleophilia bacterium]